MIANKESTGKKATAMEEEKTRLELDAQLQMMVLEEEERKKNDLRREMRQKNAPGTVAASRAAHNAGKSKLKSDLKKTSAFTSKVRTLTESQRGTISKDIETLNLSHYVSEIVDAIADAKLKTGDVSLAVHVCCMMHQRYAGFTEDLHSKLIAPFRDDPPEEDKDALRKRRINLRLLTELHIYGVFDASQTLLSILRKLSGEKKVQLASGHAQQSRGYISPYVPNPSLFPDMNSNDVSLIVAFAKHAGQEMAGVVPRRLGSLAMFTQAGHDRVVVLSPEGQEVFRNLLQSVLKYLRGQLITAHKSSCKLERRMEKDRLLCGTLSDEKQKNLEANARLYDKLLGNVTALSDALDEDMPDLPEDKEEEELAGVELWSATGLGESSLGPWDDIDTKSFYEDLADLLTVVPPSQLGLTEEQWQDLRARQDARSTIDVNEDEAGTGLVEDIESDLTEELQMLSVTVSDENSPNESNDVEIEVDDKFELPDDKATGDEDGEEGNTTSGSSGGQLLNLMLKEELPVCYNRERTDAFAIKFCHHNSKSARRKLVRALFEVPRQLLDLLPQYGRLVATLDRVLKDIAPALLEDLLGEFRWLLRKRTAATLIDSKRRNVCFIGELIKFKVAPPIVAFQCLKACFQEFTGSNIEMACMLLESCGRFLYRSKASHSRTSNYLDILQRFRQAKHLDSRYETMIDNAYYMCKPPEGLGGAFKKKQRTPLQLWIRYLLCEKLAEDTVESVLRSLRRLPWTEGVKLSNPELNSNGEEPETQIVINVMDEVEKAFLKVARKHFTAVHLAADVLAGLHRSHPMLTVRIIDAVIEELQRACEEIGGGARDLQRRLGLARFLGELYNYSIVSSGFIFEVLHRLINYGHMIPPTMKLPRSDPSTGESLPPIVAPWATYDPRAMHPCDPPGDCLRIRLVIQLLEACSEYFVVGQSRPRLDKFLIYFQRYLFCKPGLPPDTEFAVLDLLDELEGQAQALVEKELARQRRSLQAKGIRPAGKGVKGIKTVESALKLALNIPASPLLPRFDSWEAAHAAVEKIELEEYETAKKNGLVGNIELELEDITIKDEEDTFEGEDDSTDENEHDRDRREAEGSGSGSSDDNKHDEYRENDGEQPQTEEEEEEEEEEVHLYDKHEYEKSDADFEFERMLVKMQQENADKTKQLSRQSIKADNMDAPTVLSRLPLLESVAKDPLCNGPNVEFKLLKRGAKGKSEAIFVHIPSDTNLAAQVLRASTVESDERELIKARVLQYEKDQRVQETPFEPLPLLNNQPITAEAARRAAGKTGRTTTSSRGRGGRLFTSGGRSQIGGYGRGGEGGQGPKSPVHASGKAPRL